MDIKGVHKDFTLNGNSFSSKDELLTYTEKISPEMTTFLEEWFNDKNYIVAQTSGSTGVPKSISLDKTFVVNSAKATSTYFNLSAKTSALLCLPISYIAGKMMLIRALFLGWHLEVTPSSATPLYNRIETYDFAAMVPLQVENSLPQLHQIKKLIVGGGPVSNALFKKLQTSATKVYETYGMTETMTHIAVKPIQNFSEKYLKNNFSNSFFNVLPNITIYKDQRNCLVIKAPKISKDIIFTNDVVHLISDTQFEWLGRYDSIINSGGIKLNPEKIELKLEELISNRFFLTGIPDPKLGQKMVLVVASEPDPSLLSKVKSFHKLSKFEIPKEIFFLKDFTTTSSGKIQRKETLQKLKLL